MTDNNNTSNNTFYCSFVGDQWIVCECGDAYPSEETLREHVERDHEKRVTSSEAVTNQTITEYKCGECGDIFSSEQECVDHQEMDHPTSTEQVETYIKEEGIFDTSETLKIEENEPVYIKMEPYIDDIVYVQDVGEIKTEQDDQIVFMSDSDTTERLYDIVNSSSVSYQMPKDYKPRGKRQTVCAVTDGKRKRPVMPKSVVCEVCGKRYGSNAALRYHQRVHTGVRPYQCQYCQKSFTMQLFLQIHVRIHTGERPYKCTVCPKAFSNKAALLRHNRVHTGEKPYACPKCGKTFTQSNSMKLHVHTVHLKMPAPYKSARRKAEGQARASKTKRGKEDVKNPQEITQQVEESYAGLNGIYLCGIPPVKEEEVTYELIYD